MKITMDYLRRLFPLLSEITSENLQAQVLTTWKDAIELGAWKAIEQIPFTLHHPTTINLLAHTNQVTAMALKIWDVWSTSSPSMVDKDLLIAGGLLHDVGKLLEYMEDEGAVKLRPNALRHHFSGVALAEKHGLPEKVLNCIAYHGTEVKPEWRCNEAIIIHHCDFSCFELDQKRER